MFFESLFRYILGLLLVYLAVRLLWIPARHLISVVYHGVLGVISLWVFNLLGVSLGFHMPLNPVTALIAGYLGIPGVVLLVAVQRVVS